MRTPTHWNLIRRSITPLYRSITPSTVSVIAQQYSSATFVSPSLHSRKEKFPRAFKKIIAVCLLS